MNIELIFCPACGNKCSSMAVTCPTCGHPFAKENALKSKVDKSFKALSTYLQNQNKNSRKWMIATIIAGLVVIGILSFAVYSFYNGRNVTTSSQQKSVVQQNNLTIKAAVIYNYGGAQGVSRTTFYLLREDLANIANRADIIVAGVPLGMSVYMAELNDKIANKQSSRLMTAMRPYIVKTATTDFEGNTTFSDVPTGDYFIYGITQTRGGWVIWNYNVQLFKSMTISLDQNNAIYAQ